MMVVSCRIISLILFDDANVRALSYCGTILMIEDLIYIYI